jgi:hypothetical protein
MLERQRQAAPPCAAPLANSIGSTIEGSSFCGLLTRVEVLVKPDLRDGGNRASRAAAARNPPRPLQAKELTKSMLNSD